jgi:hypothetical protein
MLNNVKRSSQDHTVIQLNTYHPELESFKKQD